MADALASLGNRPRRPRRHVSSERPAGHRELPGGVGRGHGRAAESRLPRRRGQFLSGRHLRRSSACPAGRHGRAQGRPQRKGVPVYALEMDATGYVRIAGAPNGKTASAPSPDDIALILHTSGSTGRPKRVPITARQHRGLHAQHRGALRALAAGRFALRDAAVPRAWPGRFHAFDAAFRRNRRGARRSSARSRSGAPCAIPAPPGIRPCPPSTICCWRARAMTGRRAPRVCASFAPAARRCRRK